jgi:hypothetical protein
MTQLELIAEVRLPAHGTQAYELLSAMKAGKRLTIWNAMQDHRCGALHQRMKDLRDLGWPIQRREIKTESGAKIAEFWLE